MLLSLVTIMASALRELCAVPHAVRDRCDRHSLLLKLVHCFCRDLDMDFEIPFRELGFSGVPHRSTAFIMPTVCSAACTACHRSPYAQHAGQLLLSVCACRCLAEVLPTLGAMTCC